MCEKCGIDHPEAADLLPEELRQAFDDVFTGIRELDPERRHLFTEHVLQKLVSALRTADDYLADGDVANAKTLVVLAVNALNLAGYSNAQTMEENVEWTRTGDKVVEELWNKWVTTYSDAQQFSVVAFTEDDMPREAMVRLSKGEGTPEDYELMRKAVAAKGGPEIPEDAEIQFGQIGTIGTVEEPAKARDIEDAPTTGFYL